MTFSLGGNTPLFCQANRISQMPKRSNWLSKVPNLCSYVFMLVENQISTLSVLRPVHTWHCLVQFAFVQSKRSMYQLCNGVAIHQTLANAIVWSRVPKFSRLQKTIQSLVVDLQGIYIYMYINHQQQKNQYPQNHPMLEFSSRNVPPGMCSNYAATHTFNHIISHSYKSHYIIYRGTTGTIAHVQKNLVDP